MSARYNKNRAHARNITEGFLIFAGLCIFALIYAFIGHLIESI